MFAILAPITLLPLILVLEINERKAIKKGWAPRKGSLFATEETAQDSKPSTSTPSSTHPLPFLSCTSKSHSPSPHLSTSSIPRPTLISRSKYLLLASKQAASRVDLVGLFLLTASLCSILIPLSLASASQGWGSFKNIVPLAVGGTVVPLFLIWEIKFASHPVMPASLLRNRSFLGGGLVLSLFWISFNVSFVVVEEFEREIVEKVTSPVSADHSLFSTALHSFFS